MNNENKMRVGFYLAAAAELLGRARQVITGAERNRRHDWTMERVLEAAEMMVRTERARALGRWKFSPISSEEVRVLLNELENGSDDDDQTPRT